MSCLEKLQPLVTKIDKVSIKLTSKMDYIYTLNLLVKVYTELPEKEINQSQYI